jgi:hypothetical protein
VQSAGFEGLQQVIERPRLECFHRVLVIGGYKNHERQGLRERGDYTEAV